MKILIATPFYPPDFGGIEYHVSNVAGRLSEKHEVTVVTCRINSGCVRYQNRNSFKVIEIPSITPPPYPYQTLSNFRIPISLNELAKIIRSEDFDVLHAHGHHLPITWLTVNLAKAKGIPTVLTAHGIYALTWHKTLIEEIFNNTVLKWLLRRLDAIIGLTPTGVNYLKKYGPKKGNYYVIPNGVNQYIYHKNFHRKIEYRKKYGIPQEGIVILYRGRLVDVKGVLEFVAAINIINRIQSYRDKVYFVICGEGPLKEKTLQGLNRASNCKLVGLAPPECVHELYIASDAYILPSKWHEALPITLLEAMVANLYVIATPVGGVPDVLASYPWKTYIKGFDSTEIAKAIIEFLNTYHKIGRSEPLSSPYIRKFDWNHIVGEIENVYMNIRGVKN